MIELKTPAKLIGSLLAVAALAASPAAVADFAFDLPLVDLGVELGYFNLGSPSFDTGIGDVSLDVSGYSAFALAGLNLGPVGVFLKGGYASWDADIQIADLKGSDDGSDPAYGLGLRFTLGSLEVRGEKSLISTPRTTSTWHRWEWPGDSDRPARGSDENAPLRGVFCGRFSDENHPL